MSQKRRKGRAVAESDFQLAAHDRNCQCPACGRHTYCRDCCLCRTCGFNDWDAQHDLRSRLN